MSRVEPGADELRIRSLLRRHGVGPDAQPAPTVLPADDLTDPAWDEPDQPPPAPRRRAPRMPDWWKPKPTDLTTDDADDEPATDDADDEPAEEVMPEPGRWWTAQPDYYPRPHTPAALTHARDRAETAISPRTRRALYDATAAGTGWLLGLYRLFATALDDCGTHYSTAGALVLGIGGCAVIAHVWDRRTRHWWPGIAWAARIPLATAILALAIWAPGA